MLTKRRRVGVVGKPHGLSTGILQAVADGKIPPSRQVVRLEQNSLGNIHRPWRRQPYAQDRLGVQPRAGTLPLDLYRHPLHRVFRTTLLLRLNVAMNELTALIIDDADLDVRPTHVDADVADLLRFPGLIAHCRHDSQFWKGRDASKARV